MNGWFDLGYNVDIGYTDRADLTHHDRPTYHLGLICIISPTQRVHISMPFVIVQRSHAPMLLKFMWEPKIMLGLATYANTAHNTASNRSKTDTRTADNVRLNRKSLFRQSYLPLIWEPHSLQLRSTSLLLDPAHFHLGSHFVTPVLLT